MKFIWLFLTFFVVACQIAKVDTSAKRIDYKVIYSDGNKRVTNLHLFLRGNYSDSMAIDFIKSIQANSRNIFVYTDSTIGDLGARYPLSKSEYIKLAECLRAQSVFENKKIEFWPLKDSLYKAYKYN